MHASQPMPVHIKSGVVVLEFQYSWNQYKIDRMKVVPCTLAVGSRINAQERVYPDIA
jgi:hypothetical protein